MKEYLDSFYSPLGEGVEFEYLQGSYYILNECKDCGLIYQEEIPNEFLMLKLYEQWIDPQVILEEHKNNRNARHFVWVAKEIANVIQYFDTIPGQLKFLDLGMGWGEWCLMAKGLGCDVYGTEISQARIDYAKASGIKVVSWEEIPNHQFDFINTEQVFEHLADPLETLVHLKRALKPDGVIRINVPNGWDIKRRLEIWDWKAPVGSENSLNLVAPFQHINCYTYEVLVKMGQRAGLEVVVIPDQFKTTCLEDRVKAITKRYYNRLRHGRRRRRGKGTRLFFRNSIGAVIQRKPP
jgi:2-polyprenyl-3-methyl-5-hydroxy-6-metoxy-1,4-benzoquinol methylase